MELSIGKTLICPSGTPDLPDKQFDMEQLYNLETRCDELATLNKGGANELMQAMINGYGIAARAHTQLKWELTQAQKHAEERKGIVYLDVAPKILQEKGLVNSRNPAGSEGQREAVLSTDKEYLALTDRVAMIRAAIEFLHSKMLMFERTYQSIKVSFDSLSSPMGYNKTEFSSKQDVNIGTVGKPRY